NLEFKGKIAFMCTNIGQYSVTGDRATFFGLRGSQAQPAVLVNDALPEITGAGLDPCAAISAKAALEPEEEMTAVFLLGHANSQEEAVEIARHYLATETAQNELERVKQFWNDKLEAVQIHTPDDSFDIMQNGWLMYQTISCRLWARSGYYQAGGAFGFRDQLQDSMAVLNTWPELTRNQILLHASRQYREGDVQHWWHAEKGKGIRTRYTDDLLWLAFVTAEYVEKTGDLAILDEQIPFLAGNLLAEGEDEKYEEPVRIEQTASLYDHCVLAIDRALETGPHGIPLMGGGDWNDGMNTVGNKGRGESVWLGWFLISILNKFKPLCILMKDTDREQKYIDFSAKILDSIEMEAWDGSWYRRAYFDDGTPLGSVQNTECRIDSISQSWSVISGVARPQRMQEAMDAVQKYLIDRNEGIIKLLTPPFDNGDLQPGYIKGYVPGVRENGGQYTHAATWVVLAFAKMGMGDKAGELFHMLNPVNHTRTSIEYSRYKGEPYVLAADVYGEHPYTGRGGWTWYTGAAGWLYKVGLEYIAGFRKKGDKLYIEPCIPHSWSRFEMSYRSGKANYRIEVRNPDAVTSGVLSVAIDGKPCPEGFVSLSDDGGYHRIEVVMGKTEPEKAI
ncbi:MAG TPA: glycosyl transferase, partial [Clostridia bacterium]|nr:glycosyl transferase [Clostridia bacterium]